MNSKKNSCWGNYMRKYGSFHFLFMYWVCQKWEIYSRNIWGIIKREILIKEIRYMVHQNWIKMFKIHLKLWKFIFNWLELNLEYRISSYSFLPWIVAAHLCTVTFWPYVLWRLDFQIKKRNSFRRNIWRNMVCNITSS